MHRPAIASVNIGGVETFAAPDGRPLTTGIRKAPVDGLLLGPLGFPGDASSEADHHTPAKAVHLFADEQYAPVEAALGVELPRPAFGENLTTIGLMEEDVCVGDQYRVGRALICVTQPTERCRTIGRRLGLPKVLKVLHAIEACGFYARVVEPGRVSPGDTLELRARSQPTWSIKRLHRAMFRDLANEQIIAEVCRIPELSDEWKRRLQVMRGRAKRGEPISNSLAEIAHLE